MASESEGDYAYSDDEVSYDDNAMEWDKTDNPNAAPVSFRGSTTGKTGIQFKNSDEIRPEMERFRADVCEALGISSAAAYVLLRSSNWSKEKLLENYFADSDKVLKEAGVYARCGHAKPPPDRSGKPVTCNICFDDTTKMLSMPCGHGFCFSCWTDFAENAIEEGPSCITITCPDAECNEIVTEDEFSAALGQASSAMQKFQTYQLRSFVESNPLFRWCPGRGCERVASAANYGCLEAQGAVAVCDSCDTSFCLLCGDEPHAPCGCKNLETWTEKCRNESETANWILANTKSCPKCHSRIEKNQGCNHMTCQKCRFEFCWICMGDWKEHGSNTGGYYKCNKYDEDKSNDTSEAAKAKRELDRYLHYYQRYHAHQEAQEFAKKQLKETETRMIQLQESSDDARWADVEFLKTANIQLIECRRVLKYTFVYAFYMEVTPTIREKFEYHQEMLERFTESLSEMSEKSLKDMDRLAVVNTTRVVKSFMHNLLKYVEDGMDDDL